MPAYMKSNRQSGATLAIVLVLLLLIALISLASIRGAAMQEMMAGATLDRAMAFQAAEAALREGELLAEKASTSWPTGCTNGLCGEPDPAMLPVWRSDAVWASARAAEFDPVGNAIRPKLIVELLADNVPQAGSCTTAGDISDESCSGREKRYRVTARSGGEGRANVMLQSIYAVP